MTDEIKIDKTLDIKGQVCPYTFVRSKLVIEKMNLGEVFEIITDYKPASENVPRSMENEGQKILKNEQTAKKEL
jgi:TusA-related sulfurtransferase